MNRNPLRRLPRSLRRWGYRVTWLGTPVVVYCRTKNYIGDPELVLWGAYVTIFGGAADSNTNDTV